MPTLPRRLVVAFSGLFAIGLCSVQADDADAVRERLFQAKKDYDAAVQKYKKSVTDLLDKREDDARQGGKLKLVDQVKAERAAFEKSGEPPPMIPALIYDPVNSVRTRLDTVYKIAVKEYLLLKLDDAADSTEKERQQFLMTAALLHGRRTNIANLKPFDIRTHNNAPFEKDSIRFKLNGDTIPHSLYMHADTNGEASVSYALAGKMVAFRANVGIPKHFDQQKNPASPVTFEVLGDKKSLWKSEPVTTMDSFQICNVCVEKVKILTLRIHCQGDWNWSHCVWFGPIVAE